MTLAPQAGLTGKPDMEPYRGRGFGNDSFLILRRVCCMEISLKKKKKKKKSYHMIQQSHSWGFYPEKNMSQKDPWTTVLTAPPFTIAKTRKQPRCPLTDEWTKKMW